MRKNKPEFLNAMIRQMEQIRKPFFKAYNPNAIGLAAANSFDVDS
jgi:hypothetical protein